MNIINKHTVNKFRSLISDIKTAVIFMHINPDGDAVGSALSLVAAFKQVGIQTTVIVPNSIPANLQWMPNFDRILANLPVTEVQKLCNDTELIVFVDFNHYNRVEKYTAILEECNKKTILIDHHANPMQKVDLLVSNINVSSTCEIIFELLRLSKFQLTVDIASCIYAGIITDTGNFSYSSNNIHTFETVIALLKLGLDKDKITGLIYKNLPAEQVKLLGHILDQRMVIMPEKNVAYPDDFLIHRQSHRRLCHFLLYDIAVQPFP